MSIIALVRDGGCVEQSIVRGHSQSQVGYNKQVPLMRGNTVYVFNGRKEEQRPQG